MKFPCTVNLIFHAEKDLQRQIFAVIEKATWRNGVKEYYSSYNCFLSSPYGSSLEETTQGCVWMCVSLTDG